MDERQTRDEFEPHNRRVLRPPPEDEVNSSARDKEDEEYRERNRDLVIVELALSEMAATFLGDKESDMHKFGGVVWKNNYIILDAPVSNWEEMKERLKEKYLPIDYEQMMFEEMLQLRQGTLTIDQYTDRFHELTVCSKVVENEQQTLARYRIGLRNDLRKKMLNA
ncbi:hypothetical protein Patl1_15542 [Pistacia atlantica]|uniref:Uncharacterized protein n=1 Tax=Pistacia atlantica TaxID=434234 RepID=A0ACC1B6D6_9ROSI|nr:hypothetical protein Patl1_15542 [Pistacia atlantica]